MALLRVYNVETSRGGGGDPVGGVRQGSSTDARGENPLRLRKSTPREKREEERRDGAHIYV